MTTVWLLLLVVVASSLSVDGQRATCSSVLAELKADLQTVLTNQQTLLSSHGGQGTGTFSKIFYLTLNFTSYNIDFYNWFLISRNQKGTERKCRLLFTPDHLLFIAILLNLFHLKYCKGHINYIHVVGLTECWCWQYLTFTDIKFNHKSASRVVLIKSRFFE